MLRIGIALVSRAVASLRALSWALIPYPADYRVDPNAGFGASFNLLYGLSMSTIAAKEWTGLLGYRLRGSTARAVPGARVRSADKLTSKPAQHTDRRKSAPHHEQDNPAPIHQKIHRNSP
jgi:hypothetical protein